MIPEEQWADTMAGAQGLVGGCQELQGWARYALWNKPADSRPEHFFANTEALNFEHFQMDMLRQEGTRLGSCPGRVNLLARYCITTESAERKEALLCGSQSGKPGGSGLWR